MMVKGLSNRGMVESCSGINNLASMIGIVGRSFKRGPKPNMKLGGVTTTTLLLNI